ILDSAIGLEPRQWLDVDLEEVDGLLLANAASGQAPATATAAAGEQAPARGAGGSGSGKAAAKPY
ncbi:MAG: hypothetical protein GX856_10830, partial [Gammaproteobacteria bacterium]|nr:hypothetical protein [Gammaproteobacteria bacterium]